MAVVGASRCAANSALRWLEWQDQISLVKRTEFDERGYPVECATPVD